MIGAPKMAVRRSCDVTVGSYLRGDTVSGDRAIRKQLALSDAARNHPSRLKVDVGDI